MAFTVAVKLPDNTGGHYALFQSITQDLATALSTVGAVAYPWGIQGDGSLGPIGPPYTVTANFAGTGGFLLNGCPLNVIFGQGWITGQQELLKQYGVTCNTSIPSLPVSTVPANPGTVIPAGQVNTTALTSINPTSSAVAAAIAPSLTPCSPGSVPTGQSVGQTVGDSGNLGAIYRFILQSAPGRFDTGANYPGCSQVNTAMCDPQQFTSMDQAVQYAKDHDEIPYVVHSVAEVWGLIGGTIRFDQSRIPSTGISFIWIAAGIAAYFLFIHK